MASKGSVRKGKTSWYFVFDIGRDYNGKRKQLKKRGFKTEKEARQALDVAVSKLDKIKEEKFKFNYQEYIKSDIVQVPKIETEAFETDNTYILSLNETELEDLVIENLHQIEEDLIFVDRQVTVKDGRIDILAKDKSGKYCVIELKTIHDDKDLVFQCVYYPSQFKDSVRMISICPEYEKRIYDSLLSLDVEMKRFFFDESNELIIKDYIKGERNDILASNEGKQFEHDFEDSCKSQNIFYHRIKDVYLPPSLRSQIRLPKNKYDSIIFYNGHLFPIEFKSTTQKSISFSESIIKEHQILSLTEASQFDKVIPGFIFNFRSCNNFTCFIHIDDFNKYKNAVDGKLSNVTYTSKTNKSSIPIDICREIGIEIKNNIKKTHYFYDMRALTNELIKS